MHKIDLAFVESLLLLSFLGKVFLEVLLALLPEFLSLEPLVSALPVAGLVALGELLALGLVVGAQCQQAVLAAARNG